MKTASDHVRGLAGVRRTAGGVPAMAAQATLTADLDWQILPPNDGWAAFGEGTTGGSEAAQGGSGARQIRRRRSAASLEAPDLL